MSFIEGAKNAGRGLALGAALLGAASLVAVPAAQAHEWHGGGHWHGGGYHHGWGGGAALGILGGALAGAAIASSPYYYGYAYPHYGYGYGYYPYGYAYGY